MAGENDALRENPVGEEEMNSGASGYEPELDPLWDYRVLSSVTPGEAAHSSAMVLSATHLNETSPEDIDAMLLGNPQRAAEGKPHLDSDGFDYLLNRYNDLSDFTLSPEQLSNIESAKEAYEAAYPAPVATRPSTTLEDHEVTATMLREKASNRQTDVNTGNPWAHLPPHDRTEETALARIALLNPENGDQAFNDDVIADMLTSCHEHTQDNKVFSPQELQIIAGTRPQLAELAATVYQSIYESNQTLDKEGTAEELTEDYQEQTAQQQREAAKANRERRYQEAESYAKDAKSQRIISEILAIREKKETAEDDKANKLEASADDRAELYESKWDTGPGRIAGKLFGGAFGFIEGVLKQNVLTAAALVAGGTVLAAATVFSGGAALGAAALIGGAVGGIGRAAHKWDDIGYATKLKSDSWEDNQQTAYDKHIGKKEDYLNRHAKSAQKTIDQLTKKEEKKIEKLPADIRAKVRATLDGNKTPQTSEAPPSQQQQDKSSLDLNPMFQEMRQQLEALQKQNAELAARANNYTAPDTGPKPQKKNLVETLVGLALHGIEQKLEVGKHQFTVPEGSKLAKFLPDIPALEVTQSDTGQKTASLHVTDTKGMLAYAMADNAGFVKDMTTTLSSLGVERPPLNAAEKGTFIKGINDKFANMDTAGKSSAEMQHERRAVAMQTFAEKMNSGIRVPIVGANGQTSKRLIPVPTANNAASAQEAMVTMMSSELGIAHMNHQEKLSVMVGSYVEEDLKSYLQEQTAICQQQDIDAGRPKLPAASYERATMDLIQQQAAANNPLAEQYMQAYQRMNTRASEATKAESSPGPDSSTPPLTDANEQAAAVYHTNNAASMG